MLYLNETKSGNFNLSFSFADPSNSGSFINANSILSLTVNPLRIYNLLPTTADYTSSCISGNTRNIRFTAYDVFGNKVTTYKIGEDGLLFSPLLGSSPKISFDSVSSTVTA
jgi:hypothetical protein